MRPRPSLSSVLILWLASAIGAWGFLRPFLAPAPEMSAGAPMEAHAEDALWLTLTLLGLCLLVVIANLETGRMDSRRIAILGILVAINAVLRLFSGPGGANAVFFLPILAAFVFGAELGFLLAALSILASAILTSGLGPWLPFQMFAAGWTAMAAGWLPRLPGRGRRLEIPLLAAWGFLSALLYGAVVNLWFWPYLLAPREGLAYEAELGLAGALGRYALFYLTTSSWWDLARAAGSALLIFAIGPPILRLLDRFHQRLHFQRWEAPTSATESAATVDARADDP